jgi:hypothetical protein
LNEPYIKTQLTFLDGKKDERFFVINRDKNNYGEVIVKPLKFIDSDNKNKYEIAFPFVKHDSYVYYAGGNDRITENCPKNIGNKCAICDSMSNNVKSIKRFILSCVIIKDPLNSSNNGKIKLIEITPSLLSDIAKNSDNFDKVFDLNEPFFLKIVISKEDKQFTYRNSTLIKGSLNDINIKDGEQFYSLDFKNKLYDSNNFLSYEKMVSIYIDKYVDKQRLELEGEQSAYKTYKSVAISNDNRKQETVKETTTNVIPDDFFDDLFDDDVEKTDLDNMIEDIMFNDKKEKITKSTVINAKSVSDLSDDFFEDL